MNGPTIALPCGREVSLAAIAFLDDLQSAGYCVFVGRDRKVYVYLPAVLDDTADAHMRLFAPDIREWLVAIRSDNRSNCGETDFTSQLRDALRTALEEAE